MTRQERLTARANRKARAMVHADGIHELGDKDTMSYRMSSLSKPGTYHNVYLKWANGSEQGKTTGLHASCAWVEPVTDSQKHCDGNNGRTCCWHVLAGIIAALENSDKGKRVAFFCTKRDASVYARFGGVPIAILGKNVWFVVNGGRSVAQDMADLHGD